MQISNRSAHESSISLQNWHIRQYSQYSVRLQVRDTVSMIHLCKIIINNYREWTHKLQYSFITGHGINISWLLIVHS